LVSLSLSNCPDFRDRRTLTYATSAARGEARRASLLLLAVILTQLLVSLGLIGAWLARRVLGPLEILRASAEKISAGDLKSDVPALPQDEFGEPARGEQTIPDEPRRDSSKSSQLSSLPIKR
jgi:HAMP domain-containing protein